MANDNKLKIVPARFQEMIKGLSDLDSLWQGKYFENENGEPLYGKNPPKHKLRKDKQKDIAEMLGMTEANLSRNVRGLATPSANTLEFFRRNYGINPEWLCGISNDKTIRNKTEHILQDSLRIDEILKELLSINGFDCISVNYPDAPRTEDSFGYSVNGINYTYEDFHKLALKISHFVKFEMLHQITTRPSFKAEPSKTDHIEKLREQT